MRVLAQLTCLVLAMPAAGAAAAVACGYEGTGFLSPKEDLCCPASCKACGGRCTPRADPNCCTPATTPLLACSSLTAPPCAPPALPAGWALDYGTYGQNLSGCGPRCLRFTLVPPAVAGGAAQGAYIYSQDFALAAEFCATLSLQEAVSGTVFAMYTTSAEPVDRETELWDELDLEFTALEAESVWANAFHKGSQNNPGGTPIGTYAPLGARSDNTDGIQAHTYCIAWDTTAKAPTATWTRDGAVLKTMALTGWAKPMQAVISYWSTDCVAPAACDFTGPLALAAPTNAYVSDVKWVNAAPAPMAPRDTYP